MADNLTRDEARERASLINVSSYDIELDFTGSAESTFHSRTTVIFTSRRPGTATFIEIAAPKINSAPLKGQAFELGGFDGSRLPLADLAEANELVIDAECAFSRTGE